MRKNVSNYIYIFTKDDRDITVETNSTSRLLNILEHLNRVDVGNGNVVQALTQYFEKEELKGFFQLIEACRDKIYTTHDTLEKIHFIAQTTDSVLKLYAGS